MTGISTIFSGLDISSGNSPDKSLSVNLGWLKTDAYCANRISAIFLGSDISVFAERRRGPTPILILDKDLAYE